MRKAEVDIGKVNALRKGPPYRDGSIGVTLPFDCPAYIRVHRLVEATENHDPERGIFSESMKGWVWHLELIGWGLSIYVRMDINGKVKIISEEEGVKEKLAEWTQETLPEELVSG